MQKPMCAVFILFFFYLQFLSDFYVHVLFYFSCVQFLFYFECMRFLSAQFYLIFCLSCISALCVWTFVNEYTAELYCEASSVFASFSLSYILALCLCRVCQKYKHTCDVFVKFDESLYTTHGGGGGPHSGAYW